MIVVEIVAHHQPDGREHEQAVRHGKGESVDHAPGLAQRS